MKRLPNVVNDIVLLTLPSAIDRTDSGQTKEELEKLFPSVLKKVYTGDSSELNETILSATVSVTSHSAWEVDVKKEIQLNKMANYLEETILPYGHSDLLNDLFRTHEPIRARLLNSSGVEVRWQRKR